MIAYLEEASPLTGESDRLRSHGNPRYCLCFSTDHCCPMLRLRGGDSAEKTVRAISSRNDPEKQVPELCVHGKQVESKVGRKLRVLAKAVIQQPQTGTGAQTMEISSCIKYAARPDCAALGSGTVLYKPR